MEEWKEYKLGDLYEVHNGLSKGGKFFGSGFPFLSFKTVFNNYFLPHTLSDLVQTSEKERINFDIKQGDVFVTRTSETPEELGMSCVALKDYPDATYNGFTKRLRPITNKVIPEFIGYYLRSSKFRSIFYGLASSMSTRASLANGDLLNMRVELPSTFTQRRIASILSSLDSKIEINRRINANLEQQAQALFKSWFVDFEPFKDREFVESELGRIPKGWRVQEAQEVFEINIGKTPPRKESEWFTESKDNNVWVSIADMGSCGVFISESSEYLTDEAIKRFNVLMVEKDSVLLSFKLTVGRVAIADTRLTTNEAIARFILPDKCYREFLYLYLKQYKYGNLGSTSSIATAVNSKTIKGMKLIISPTDIIESFSKNTRPLFEQIRTLQQESRRLSTLRDALLPRLMSGELHVKDIERTAL